MNTRDRENIPQVSTQDALQHLTEVQKEYGVILEFAFIQPAHNGKRGNWSVVWKVKRLHGQKGYVCIHTRALDYPSRQFATFPAMVIHSVSNIVLWLESERDREKAALEQTQMFA